MLLTSEKLLKFLMKCFKLLKIWANQLKNLIGASKTPPQKKYCDKFGVQLLLRLEK